jgi:hypothetical protein
MSTCFQSQLLPHREHNGSITKTDHSEVSRTLMLLLLLLLLLLTAVELSLGGSSPYTSTDKQIRINIHKRNNKKITVQAIQNTVNTSKHVTKTQ